MNEKDLPKFSLVDWVLHHIEGVLNQDSIKNILIDQAKKQCPNLTDEYLTKVFNWIPVYIRDTGKTTFNTILAILAASNNMTVVYIVPNYYIAKDVELKIIDLSVRLGFNETSIRNYIKIQTGDTIKGMIEKESLIIDDRR